MPMDELDGVRKLNAIVNFFCQRPNSLQSACFHIFEFVIASNVSIVSRCPVVGL